MAPQNISLVRKDIISLLQTNEDLSLLEKIKSLLILENEKSEMNEPDVPYIHMNEADILKQAQLANEEIKQGKTISHEEAYKEFKKW